MDESYSINYAYISCCLIILSNIVYLIFTFIKFFIQHQRRKRLRRQVQKMTETTNETTILSKMATKSSTTITAIKTTNNRNGYERFAQLYPHVGDDVRLPTKWNAKDKASTLALQQNDLVVTYKGNIVDVV